MNHTQTKARPEKQFRVPGRLSLKQVRDIITYFKYAVNNFLLISTFVVKKDFAYSEVFYAGKDLSFQAVTRQVLSAQLSLTSVFGMGTGGTSA